LKDAPERVVSVGRTSLALRPDPQAIEQFPPLLGQEYICSRFQIGEGNSPSSGRAITWLVRSFPPPLRPSVGPPPHRGFNCPLPIVWRGPTGRASLFSVLCSIYCLDDTARPSPCWRPLELRGFSAVQSLRRVPAFLPRPGVFRDRWKIFAPKLSFCLTFRRSGEASN